MRAQRAVLGPCPNGDGEIRENRIAYGCSSWQSREQPGCGFVIWKTVRGEKGEVDVETARAMVARGETNAQAPPSKEPLGPCPTPGCPGQIVENTRAFGCTSWKSRSNPGCGFVIWKKPRGKPEVTREDAVELLAEARAAAAGAPAPAAAPS